MLLDMSSWTLIADYSDGARSYLHSHSGPGFSDRHGPHHEAQRLIRVGSPDSAAPRSTTVFSPRHVALIPRSSPSSGRYCRGHRTGNLLLPRTSDVKTPSRRDLHRRLGMRPEALEAGSRNGISVDVRIEAQIATTRRPITTRKSRNHRDCACMHFLQAWCGEPGNNTELLLCIVDYIGSFCRPSLNQRQGSESND